MAQQRAGKMTRSIAGRSAGLVAIALITRAVAGEADVVDVDVACREDRKCDFDVTVRHADAGWEHYANKWEIVTTSGRVLATRKLAHPHDHEQPFTRSLINVAIPDGIDTVIVRASDSVHGIGGSTVSVRLPSRE